MRKQPERTGRTRQALIDSFWRLYQTKRIEKITVQEVVDGAKVYRSTFYEYFRDVYEVLETIEDTLLKRFESMRSKTCSADDLTAMVDDVLSFYEANGAQIAHLLSPNGDAAFTARAMKAIKINFMQSLHLSPDDIQQDVLFDMIASSILALLNYWYANQAQTSIREVFQAGWPIMCQGFLPYLTELKVRNTQQIQEEQEE